MESTSRSRKGLALIAGAVLIFVWSLWITVIAYTIYLPHPGTGWSESQLGMLACVFLIIGTVLFVSGTFLVTVPKRPSPDALIHEQPQQHPSPP